MIDESGPDTPGPGFGHARDIFFRPQRYVPSEFEPLTITIEVHLSDDTVWHPTIENLSQTGVAFEFPPERPLLAGEILPRVWVQFGNHGGYDGGARVENIRAVSGRVITGVSFTEGLLSVAEILQTRDVWRGAGASLLTVGDWETPGAHLFKARVADMRLFLDDADRFYAALEASLPWEVVHGDPTTAPARALRERVAQEFVGAYVARSNAINDAFLEVPPDQHDALRAWSRRNLQDSFLRSPLMRRALQKPLGYPGDFEVMRFLYENRFSGPTLAVKALTLAISTTGSCAAVRSRKDLIRDRLDALLESRRVLGNPVRVLSVAAGPAQEIWELLNRRAALPVPLEVVLVDQDPDALASAFDRLRSLVLRRPELDVRVTYLKDNILRPRVDLLTAQGTYDFLFTCGLFDYFKRPIAQTRASVLFRCLSPGGIAYIGNMTPEAPSRWMMELHLDWDLHYRTRAELLALGAAAAPEARIRIDDDASAINPFLVLERA